MKYKYDASIIGGDLRQIYLSSIMEQSGFKIIVYGLNGEIPVYNMNYAESLEHAMESSKTIIAPIPFSKDKFNISSTCITDGSINLSVINFLDNLKSSHYLIAGNIPNDVKEFCNAKNICFTDLMNNENIALLNAISTAEGAIAEAISKSVINLHKSKCLVLGYGRCAKVLSSKLNALGAIVTVSARKKEALTEAFTNCCDCMGLDILDIHDFDFIFNTIPSLILNMKLLSKVSCDSTIIDIASYPGGLDYEYSKEHKINAHLCLGIPGKTAPKSSALILAETIVPILKERSD